jgi:ferredoxin
MDAIEVRTAMTAMKVWIDQEACTGDAQCVDVCPEVFFMHDDGGGYLAYGREAGDPGCDPGGTPTLRMREGRATVPHAFVDAVLEAADLCPGECIVVDVED